MEKAIRLILALDSSPRAWASEETILLAPKTREQLLRALGEELDAETDLLIGELLEAQAVPEYIPPETAYRTEPIRFGDGRGPGRSVIYG